jgi:hypothetical protein
MFAASACTSVIGRRRTSRIERRSPGGKSWRCSRLSWRNNIGCASETFASGTRASQLTHPAASKKAGFCSLPAAGDRGLLAAPAFEAVVSDAYFGIFPDTGMTKSERWPMDVFISISW